MELELELCPACEKGTLAPVRKAGRRMPYKHIPDLEIPADFAIPTCTRCGAEPMGDKDIAALDKAMARAYTAALASKAEEAVRALGQIENQRDLERLVGLSAGYLSKLKHRKAEPHPSTTALLILLADQPALLGTLRRQWSMTVTAPSRPSSDFWSSLVTRFSQAEQWTLPVWQTRNQLDSWVHAERTSAVCLRAFVTSRKGAVGAETARAYSHEPEQLEPALELAP